MKRVVIRLLVASIAFIGACTPVKKVREVRREMPASYAVQQQDSLNSASIPWTDFFDDPHLKGLITEALSNNQELNVLWQRISIAKNEIKARKGEYLPFVGYRAGAELEKSSRYTRNGAVEEQLELEGKPFPDPLGNLGLGLEASWELDIWKKLRSAKKAAVMEYLATVEGRNFMMTQLVAEIAENYFELVALDTKLEIINQNLRIQGAALEVVRLQKKAARATNLAVKRFEAEVLKNKSEKYDLKQRIVEVENALNFLIGRKQQVISRNTDDFLRRKLLPVHAGLPASLLSNRPDVRKAEYELAAAKLNVKVARARFYPSLGLKAGVGLQAFNSQFLTQTPGALVYRLGADLVGPLINRNAIKAAYSSASSEQLARVFDYEKTLLKAFLEVENQLAKVENLAQSYQLQSKQVLALTQSIGIANKLYQSARADYMEVLLTQRDALESKMALVETKKEQFVARVSVYKALGGGWK
ncbi:RND transporter [Tenacibaculum litopenaei]|uniref:TolC family protein n=1 Tax=Tenacibaculum litopenaei TaxID=396016 RepID=UPI0038966C67